MAQKLLITTGGYIPGIDETFTQNVSEVDIDSAIENLPQMLRSITSTGIRQIEDPEHPLNGWIIEEILIEPMGEYEDE